MNKNKGIIGIGLIMAIVLGIVVVGGGAYSYSTYKNKWREFPPLPFSGNNEFKNPENILPNNENKNIQSIKQNDNLPAVEEQKVIPTTPQVATDCNSSSKPSIKVLSPNRGEIYTIGQKITVKWEGCNLTSSTNLTAFLERQAPLPDSEWLVPILFVNVKGGQNSSSSNGGQQIINLDSSHNVVPASYKLCISQYVTPAGKDTMRDCSDNSFTINSAPVKTVSTTSCTSDNGNVMTYSKALEFAKASSCNAVGTFISKYSCNKNAGGLIDVFMKPANQPNCSFACRVSIDTGKAEEGWMCTGAKLPTTSEGCGFNGERC